MAQVLGAIKAILDLVKAVKTVSDLFGNNAKEALTLQDLREVAKGAHWEFFKEITLEKIDLTHRDFYGVWLPTVVKRGQESGGIRPEDMTRPEGALYHIYPKLLEDKSHLAHQLSLLKTALDAIDGSTRLVHPDENIAALYSFFHGYGLLFHMQAVCAELHRIETRSTSLDDPVLYSDALMALQYVKDLQTAIEPGKPDAITVKRHKALTEIIMVPAFMYRYMDFYQPLNPNNSERHLQPTEPPPPQYAHFLKEDVESTRAQRLSKIDAKIHAVLKEPWDTVWAASEALEKILNARIEKQKSQGLTAPA